MADIFISFTSSDREWAFWIAHELEALGHTPHIHEWEISGGDDIYAWMEFRHDAADHVLCVVSDAYLKAPYSTLERNAALWQAASGRPGFVLLVAVKPCRFPTLADHIRRCELYGVSEDIARERFRAFMAKRGAAPASYFPGQAFAVSNIPVRVPAHFLGRDDSLAAIESALDRYEGRVAITALHGLRGVGKTTLAAAYAERHRGDYRATWWVRAQTPEGMRADLVALGVRLGWVAADDKEEPALAAVMERLRQEGEGLLLVYDNTVDAKALKPYLPAGGQARILVTSNAHAWRGVAELVEIRLWPKEIGADYLIARTGRDDERDVARALSEALGGLPLAHEQAAAYCERLDLPLAEYQKRFAASPAKFLDTDKDAPAEYHDGLTVAKTFALAIEEAARLHPAAEPLIVHAAFLAPEPIPLFLFSEGREQFAEPLASALADDGLDEAVAALRTFALVDRETVPDERDPSVTTDCIRLHRLVRQVAAMRGDGDRREDMRAALVKALAAVYPPRIWRDPRTWPRARRLDAQTVALLGDDALLPEQAEAEAANVLMCAGQYRQYALAAFAEARALLERAAAIRERVSGPEDRETATSLNNLALLLEIQGDLAGSRRLFERTLAIREKVFGAAHPDTASCLNNLGNVLQQQGDLAGARPLFERALAIYEKVHGAEHADTASCLANLAFVLKAQGDLAGARSHYERALTIFEKVLGPEHPNVAISLNNLALLLQQQGELAEAQALMERAVAIREKTLGPEHPGTATSLNNLARLLQRQGDLAGARPLMERALAILEKTLGPEHRNVASGLNNMALLLQQQGDVAGSRALMERALAITEKALGPEHPSTAISLNNLGRLLQDQGDLAGAQPLMERALAISETALGREHPETNRLLGNVANLMRVANQPAEALPLAEAALASHDKALGTDHPWTRDSAEITADVLAALGRSADALALRRHYGVAKDAGAGP